MEISHSDPKLGEARTLSVTFEWQKKDTKNDMVTQNISGDHTLCGVKQGAALVRRIKSYPGSNDDTPISAVWRDGGIDHITSDEMTTALRGAVLAFGEDRLGFKADDVGCYSLRSGGAMAMFLGECPVFVIMMIGQWSSHAFLRYIRKQVEQFSHNVAPRMLRYEVHYYINPNQRGTSNQMGNALRAEHITGQQSPQWPRPPVYNVFT